jgi:hypothetical protein
LAITQPVPGPFLLAGDPVYLIQTGVTWRVVRTDSLAPVANRPTVNDARVIAPRPSLSDESPQLDGRL